MLDVPILAVSALLALGPARVDLPLSWPPAFLAPGGPAASAPPPTYGEDARAVSNWRAMTRTTLEPAPLAAAAALLASGRPVVTRCVKLNNPWCIKRARWNGEIGYDEEGHTAFASTDAGADAAANLLRTYYVGSGRRSALDIVRRWAPAECHIGGGGIGLSATLAVRGLANTLRGRFLAGRSRTGTAQPAGRRAAGGPRLRVSAVPLPRMPSYRVPDLAPGMGERRVAPTPSRQARVPSRTAEPRVASRKVRPARVRIAALSDGLPPMPSVSLCGSAEGRIQYYAIAIARALGVGPADDLKLFTEAGQPTENLLPVMVAMSAVELGALHAGPELVGGAIERLKIKLAEAAAPPPPPPPSNEMRRPE